MPDDHVFEAAEILEMAPITDDLRGRALPSLTFYDPDYDRTLLPEYMDDEDWILFLQRRDGKYHVLKGEAAESAYYGTEPADDQQDVLIPFIDLYFQHFSWPEMLGLFPGLVEDVRNFATILSKLAIYQRMIEHSNLFTRRIVTTELEYMFNICRSFYDVFQSVASKTWKMVELSDGGKNPMPYGSFSRVALSNESPRDAADLREDYGLTDDLAAFYAKEGEMFSKIKNFRDSIEHEGKTLETIYPAEDGLAVISTDSPYSEFDIWSEDQIGKNGMAPLWPFVATIIHHTLSIMPRFFEALSRGGLSVAPDLVPGYNVYMRGPHLRNLSRLEELCNEDQWGANFVDDITKELGNSVS